MINCDDDLRFFLEDASVTKLIFDYGVAHEMSRKRHLADDECSESSKKIRKKLQEMELDSDSSFDTDDQKEAETVVDVTSTNEEPVASTSKSNVEIINVEIVKAGNGSNTSNCQSDNTTVENQTTEVTVPAKEIATRTKKQYSEIPNRIVISDSSDDEEQPRTHNRRYSESNYSSRYSFAGTNNGHAWASFEDDTFFNPSRSRFRDEFHQRQHEHVTRIYQNARANAEAIRQNALRNIRNSSNLFPQMLSTFQAHFRPLFRQPNFNSHSRTYRQ